MADLTRREEIANRLAVVRTRIDRACDAAGRDPAEVTLIAITKTFPVSDIEHLLALGVADIGENRDQEAAPKAAALEGRGVRWHFVGQLQTNKCRSVAAYAQAVHSVDRLRLVGALSAAAERTGRRSKPSSRSRCTTTRAVAAYRRSGSPRWQPRSPRRPGCNSPG
jgi:uncharacterized pyridoxal phosphate-containing UPF0001 family protein